MGFGPSVVSIEPPDNQGLRAKRTGMPGINQIKPSEKLFVEYQRIIQKRPREHTLSWKNDLVHIYGKLTDQLSDSFRKEGIPPPKPQTPPPKESKEMAKKGRKGSARTFPRSMSQLLNDKVQPQHKLKRSKTQQSLRPKGEKLMKRNSSSAGGNK